MKKIIIIVFSFILAATLVSCGGDEEASDFSGEVSDMTDISVTEDSSEEIVNVSSLVIPESGNRTVLSSLYELSVKCGKNGEWKPLPCFKATVGVKTVSIENGGELESAESAFCYFGSDFEDDIYISVKPNFEFSECIIRPISENIKFTSENNEVIIKITHSCMLSLEFDGDLYGNLQIFANSYKTEKVSESDSNVIYYGPGVYNVGEIKLKSGETLYLDSGAYVYGYVSASNAENIAIKGSGVLSGGKTEHKIGGARKNLIYFSDCSDITVEGVILLDSSSWTMNLRCCENLKISNIKHICWYFNSDGIDLCSCRNVEITNCYLRNYDDNISIKAINSLDCTDIKMNSCILWADCAHNMLVGPEAKESGYSNVFEDIKFENITVLQQNQSGNFYKGVMALTCTDNAIFNNIEWNNIVIERMTDGSVINFRFSDDYGETYGKSINNIRVNGVECLCEPSLNDQIIGMKGKYIRGIVITDYTVGNKVISAEDYNANVSYTENLTVDGVVYENKSTPSKSENRPCLYLKSSENGNGMVQTEFPAGTFEYGKTYVISATVKFIDLDYTKGSDEQRGCAYVNVYQYAEDGSLTSFRDFAYGTLGDTDWREYSYTFEPVANQGNTSVGIGFWDCIGSLEISEIIIYSSDGDIILSDNFASLNEELWSVGSSLTEVKIIE